MIPLVGSVMELFLIRDESDAILRDVAAETGVQQTIPIGTMIELPRAALTATRIAEAAEFFSFGTNDLTQTTWGFSRDDVEAAFFATYLDRGVFTVSPFESLDVDGVGRLVADRRRRRPPHPPRPQARRLRRARRRPGVHPLLPPRRASTTSPARRSACRSPASRPVAPPSSAPDPPPCRHPGSRAAVPWQGFGSGWQWDGSRWVSGVTKTPG